VVSPVYFEIGNECLTDSDDTYHYADYDLIFTIGGDGTFIYAARTFLHLEVPFVGINAGRLGFLMDISVDEIEMALDEIVEGSAKCVKRMLLDVQVHRVNQEICSFQALNEVVIAKGTLSRMIDIHMRVNETDFSDYRADGVIISTPTGSTAYNLSAGGPILTPEMEALVITPICPHSLNIRPVVSSSSSRLELWEKSTDGNTLLTIDGQENLSLEQGDVVRICRSKHSIYTYYLKDNDFFKTLRNKLGWHL